MSLRKFSVLLLFAVAAANAPAAVFDTIGYTLLHQVAPTLTGNAVPVAQVEAPNTPEGPNAFEVNPSAVDQPTNLFTWYSSSGTSTMFTNLVGTESSHADAVGNLFYGLTNGIAPGVSHVDNYEADFFANTYITTGAGISARIVNQSFIFDTNGEATIDADYDNYADQFGVLFVSGVGNGGPIFPAASCYNGIGVGDIGGSTSFGPTFDGRCKPDLVAPSVVTSFSTPQVSGSAAVLIQAALRGDGGADTNSANDNRTVKALLLNGAVKPSDWTNGVMSPLDARYGAGVLNVFNSWNDLRGGEHPFVETTTVTDGSPHPPGSNPANETALVGWDLNSISTPIPAQDAINHYYFNLTGSNNYTVTATLNWLRPQSIVPGQLMGINDLNLFLYNAANGNLILCSTSQVDNVEHLYVRTLPPGRYDLQVQKNPNGQVSPSETYALAFEFFNISLNIAPTNSGIVVSWPLAPNGFQLQSTPSITPPATWSPVTATVTVDTNASQNSVILPITTTNQFFRLQR